MMKDVTKDATIKVIIKDVEEEIKWFCKVFLYKSTFSLSIYTWYPYKEISREW